MGNHHTKSLKSGEANVLHTKFSNSELHMLGLIYEDLANRHFGMVDKETFLKFSPLTGLWGEQLFKRFDQNHTGLLTFYEFAMGMAMCCKSSEEEKIRLLFSLYDFDNDGFIEKKEIVTMLFNFPKNHIKFITDEIAPDRGEKLEQLTEARRKQSMANANELGIGPSQPLNIDSSSLRSSYGRQADEINEAKPGQNDLEKLGYKQKDKTSTMLELDGFTFPPRKGKNLDAIQPSRGISSAKMMNPTSPLRANVLSSNRARKMSQSITNQSFVQATTINNRVKEYASIVFNSFEGASVRGKLSYEEFTEWLMDHPVILKLFENSFHEEFWSQHINHIGMKPINSLQLPYQSKPPDIAGILYKKGKKTRIWKKRYYELRGDFLLYNEKEGAALPKGILFLEGVFIEELKDFHHTQKYGFRINYKTESYHPHDLYTSHKNQFDEWMIHLKSFKNLSIHDMYQFKERIGTGKFSIVYRAISKMDNTSEYAVKVIEKGGLKPEEREFLLSETSVMKVLNHPSMIKLIETIETKATIYIVTELVKDGDLYEYIVAKEFLEEYEASLVMKILFTAINYLHNVGIIHRDIKPENLLISLSKEDRKIKEIKLIDFGFAQFITPGVLLRETCGTPNYVAPEVLRGNGYDRRADIWSLGIIMFLILRGRLPFDSHTVDEILRNTIKMEIPLDEDHWDNISNEGKDLLLRLLERDVNKRISIQEALHHPWITNREGLKYYMHRNQHTEDDQINSY